LDDISEDIKLMESNLQSDNAKKFYKVVTEELGLTRIYAIEANHC